MASPIFRISLPQEFTPVTIAHYTAQFCTFIVNTNWQLLIWNFFIVQKFFLFLHKLTEIPLKTMPDKDRHHIWCKISKSYKKHYKTNFSQNISAYFCSFPEIWKQFESFLFFHTISTKYSKMIFLLINIVNLILLYIFALHLISKQAYKKTKRYWLKQWKLKQLSARNHLHNLARGLI